MTICQCCVHDFLEGNVRQSLAQKWLNLLRIPLRGKHATMLNNEMHARIYPTISREYYERSEKKWRKINYFSSHYHNCADLLWSSYATHSLCVDATNFPRNHFQTHTHTRFLPSSQVERELLKSAWIQFLRQMTTWRVGSVQKISE